MGDVTGIEWTDATWNPVRGCSRVSEGCRNCYAEKVAQRFCGPGQPYEGLVHGRTKGWNGKVRLVDTALAWPLKKRKPRRIFVNSMSDLFHESVPDDFIAAVFGIMAESPQHTFQILTKRPERMRAWFDRAGAAPRAWLHEAVKGVMGYDNPQRPAVNEDRWPLPNVWLGVSVEDQEAADVRVPLLLQVPAAVRWLSVEPLLAPVDLSGWLFGREAPCAPCPRDEDCECGWSGRHKLDGEAALHWIVVGGESGARARPMHPDWARSLRDQCAAAGVPFLFKQWGAWEIASVENGHHGSVMPETGERYTWLGLDGRTQSPSSLGLTEAYAMARVSKKRSGRLLDGALHDGYPQHV
ncbi:MAG: phage Gp37/Gp68 family protein [Stenotrophomonas sp.]|nr:phage Gp37/Gp68 family protein [Stenotrophomonas sp.]